jgi:arginase
MGITLIKAPIATGTTQKGMALAPERYEGAGAATVLRARGHDVRTVRVEPGSEREDLEAVVHGNIGLASEVRRTADVGDFPLVLGGACNVCLGSMAGLGAKRLGVVWLDAHGDFNTPETSPSGYFDGMPLAVLTGRGHRGLRGRIGGEIVPEGHVLHIGARDLDPEEGENLHRSEILVVPAAAMRETGIAASLRPALEQLAAQVDGVYLHLDIDVLDPAFAPAVNFPTPDGLTLDALEETLRLVSGTLPLRAASLTAYDPTRDVDGTTLHTGLQAMQLIAAGAALPRPV